MKWTPLHKPSSKKIPVLLIMNPHCPVIAIALRFSKFSLSNALLQSGCIPLGGFATFPCIASLVSGWLNWLYSVTMKRFVSIGELNFLALGIDSL